MRVTTKSPMAGIAKKMRMRRSRLGEAARCHSRAGIMPITSPVTGSIFRTGDAAPCDPNSLSKARLYSVDAVARYAAVRRLRLLFFRSLLPRKSEGRI